MKLIATLLLTTVFSFTVFGQNYIGKPKEEVKNMVKQYEPYFSEDSFVTKKVFNYIKYVDGINQQTYMFMFNDNDICTSTKLMSDYANMEMVLEKLDDNYKKIDKTNWEYADGGKTFSVILEEGEWYFSIKVKEKK